MMKTGKCTQCGVELNLDAIGMTLQQWNLEHQTRKGCAGEVKG